MSHALLGSLREILGHVALATGRAGSLLLSWHEGEFSLNEKPFSKGPGASGIVMKTFMQKPRIAPQGMQEA